MSLYKYSTNGFIGHNFSDIRENFCHKFILLSFLTIDLTKLIFNLTQRLKGIIFHLISSLGYIPSSPSPHC